VEPVLLGEVIGVFGFRGEVRVLLHHREGTALGRPREVALVAKDGSRRRVRLTVRSGAGKRLVGRIDGVEDEAGAQALVGSRIEVDRAELPPPAEGEWYIHDLIGARVRDVSGVDHGVLTDVVPGVVDVWVIGDGEAFVVAAQGAIRAVDLANRTVTVADGAVERG